MSQHNSYQQQPAEIGWDRFDLDCAVPIVAW
jgi:hypothetical protein